MDLMKLYNISPVFIQNLMCSAEGYRVKRGKYGKEQKKHLVNYMRRNNWSYEQLIQYRDSELRKMVRYCYFHVPYYRDLFDRERIDYESIRTLDDLAVIPILTKQIVRENFDSLIADSVNRGQLMRMHTSGTTGSAFHFYITKDTYTHWWAAEQRYMESIGIKLNEWKAYFGGRSIVPKGSKKPPFYRVNYPMKEILFSSFHLSPAFFPSYIEGMNKYRPLMWHGFASTIEAFAQYLLDSEKQLNFVPEIILLTAENVHKSSLSKITRAFGVRPIQAYGQSEMIATFKEFPGEGMYVIEDLSAVEFLPDESGLYRVIGTTLTNYGMPFLRYDTRDLVDFELDSRGRRITVLDGREEDSIKLRDGGMIRRLDFIFKDQINIVESCIVQKSVDMVEVQIVKGPHYSESDEITLKKDLNEYLAGKIDFSIAYVDLIKKTKCGKRKFIISEIK